MKARGWVGVAFEPDELLELDTVYDAGIPANSVFDATRSATFPAISWNFRTVPTPSIIGSDPFDGQGRCSAIWWHFDILCLANGRNHTQ